MVQGWVQGFRDLGLRDFGFRDSGFRVSGVSGFRGCGSLGSYVPELLRFGGVALRKESACNDVPFDKPPKASQHEKGPPNLQTAGAQQHERAKAFRQAECRRILSRTPQRPRGLKHSTQGVLRIRPDSTLRCSQKSHAACRGPRLLGTSLRRAMESERCQIFMLAGRGAEQRSGLQVFSVGGVESKTQKKNSSSAAPNFYKRV